jgi:hypothetical protein
MKKKKHSKKPKTKNIDDTFEEFHRKNIAKWSKLIPEITFVLYLLDAIRDRETIEVIADQAVKTYPHSFKTYVGRKKVPDLALILLTLNEAKKREWGYLAGNWYHGWRLTKKGRSFAEDVWRRKTQKKK